MGAPLTNNKVAACFSKTWDCSAYLSLDKDQEMLMPGEDSKISAKLLKPMVMEIGQQFTLRSGKSTIATGKITGGLATMTKDEREFLTLSKKKKEKLLGASK